LQRKPSATLYSLLLRTSKSYEMVRDAVICHFEEENRPKIIRLHFVREEVIAV